VAKLQCRFPGARLLSHLLELKTPAAFLLKNGLKISRLGIYIVTPSWFLSARTVGTCLLALIFAAARILASKRAGQEAKAEM
jgi:hypothetical protein